MKKIVITVDELHLSKINDLLRALMNKGFKATQVMKNLGVIMGTIDELEKIVKIEGVLKVDVVKELQVLPPVE